MRSSLVFVSLLALFSVPGLAATPKPAGPSPARRLPSPDDVSPKMRQALKARMGQHATSTQNLVRAVVLLDRPTIHVLAERIADDKTFAPSATENLDIPRSVFAEAEAFAAAARELESPVGPRTSSAPPASSVWRFHCIYRAGPTSPGSRSC